MRASRSTHKLVKLICALTYTTVHYLQREQPWVEIGLPSTLSYGMPVAPYAWSRLSRIVWAFVAHAGGPRPDVVPRSPSWLLEIDIKDAQVFDVADSSLVSELSSG